MHAKQDKISQMSQPCTAELDCTGTL